LKEESDRDAPSDIQMSRDAPTDPTPDGRTVPGHTNGQVGQAVVVLVSVPTFTAAVRRASEFR
jgi:hypothetical protein